MLELLLLFPVLQGSPCDVFLIDSENDQLVRLADLDGDGSVRSIHEASALWRSPGAVTPRALDFRTEGGAPVAYWVESTHDRIHRGVDLNGNGAIEAFEDGIYRDSKALDGASLPLGLAATVDGALWWCSDTGFSGLFRCLDRDGDGLARAMDELEILVDGKAGGHPIQTDAGVVLVDPDHLVALAPDGNGVVAYGTGADEAFFRFEDLNADGDVLDPGESRLFLNATGKNPGLPRNADWEAGRLRSLVVPSGTGGTFYGRLSHFASAREGAATAWYLACDSSATGPYGTNLYGLGLNGIVFRGVDGNGDGDLQDAGEVELFYDGSHTSQQQERFHQVLGLDACGGAVHVAHLRGAGKLVARLVDRNADGDATDSSEVEFARFDSIDWTGIQPFGSAAPFVRGLAAHEADVWARPNALFETSEAPCSLLDSKVLPTLHGIGRARIGRSDFTCELRNTIGGTFAVLFIGDDGPSWYGKTFPFDMAAAGYPGCYQHVPFQDMRFVVTSGPPAHPTAGFAAYTFDVPDFPELVGKVFALQWLVADIYSAPFVRIAMTGRGEIEIEE